MPDEPTSMAEQTVEQPTEQLEQTEQPTTGLTAEIIERLNYEELLKTDKRLQQLIDKKATQAAKTAAAKEKERQQILMDKRLSEEARLKAMTAEERVQELIKQNNELKEQFERQRAADSLRSTVLDSFAEKNIPKEFANLIDYSSATAESIKDIIDKLSAYEYYGTGELEKRAVDLMEKRLKQKTMETRQVSGDTNYQQQYEQAMKNKNMIEALRIKRVAFQEGKPIRG